MEKKISARQIVSFLRQNHITYEYCGDGSEECEGFSSIVDYKNNTLTWLKSYEKYLEFLNKGIFIEWDNISLIVVDKETSDCISFVNAIICDNPKQVFYRIVEYFYSNTETKEPVGRHTFIDEKAQIAEGVVIGNGCYIGKNVVIGEKTKIYHNVVINSGVRIGKNCCIKSGAVIGEEGYGYFESDGKFQRVFHSGSVEIEDNVDIGANTCIDKGTIQNTKIGEGSKIDNLCHIAHNVQIGKNVSIVAGVIVAGSTSISDNAYIAPGAIIRNQLSIGKGGIVGMGSVVTRDTKECMVYTGVPAKTIRKKGKENL